jgi:predicted O-methyltransferase YrrM
MDKNIRSFDDVALKYGTDKSSERHDYMKYYQRHLPEKVTSILEIGAFKGASLRMWKELYPEARIVCFDLFQDPDNITKEEVEALGVEAIQGDQGYTQDLARIQGTFDVIIDDGSHRSDHQIISLNYLWDKVNPGGWYVVEDLDCALEPFYWMGRVTSFEWTLLHILESGALGEKDKLYHGEIAFLYK